MANKAIGQIAEREFKSHEFMQGPRALAGRLKAGDWKAHFSRLKEAIADAQRV